MPFRYYDGDFKESDWIAKYASNQDNVEDKWHAPFYEAFF